MFVRLLHVCVLACSLTHAQIHMRACSAFYSKTQAQTVFLTGQANLLHSFITSYSFRTNVSFQIRLAVYFILFPFAVGILQGSFVYWT